MLIVKLQIPQPKARNKTLMNRGIQTPNKKSFLRLIQCNPPKDAVEDNAITSASTGIYRLMLSLHFPPSAPDTATLNLRISVAITTARCAQAVASCSEHFAKPKCYYALTLTTFGLRFSLRQLLSVLLCLYTCTQFSNILCFPFSWLLLLVHFTLMCLYGYALLR